MITRSIFAYLRIIKSIVPKAVRIICLIAIVQPITAAINDYSNKVKQSHFVGRPLVWVGEAPPSETEARELWTALGEGKAKSRGDAASSLEDFVKAHPNSTWRPAIEDRLGTYYRDSGYFSLALDHWEAGWNLAKEMKDPKAISEADHALTDWMQLLASLGRTDEMKSLFDQTSGRLMTGFERDTYNRLKHAYRHMLVHPEDSYRCGTYALSAVGHALTRTNVYPDIAVLASPQRGFSMAELMAIANSNQMDLVAVEKPLGDDLVVPSIVHWKENHYAAITEKRGDMFRVADPTFQLNRWLTADAINHEASGQFLIPAKQKPADWPALTMAECSHIFGKGFPIAWASPPGPPCTQCPCPPGSGGSGGSSGSGYGSLGGGPGGGLTLGASAACSSCGGGGQAGTGGMPQWTVTEPNTMLWVIDEPLAYQTATGGRMSFKTYYYDEQTQAYPLAGVSFTFCWAASWVSYIEFNGGTAALYPAGGGMRQYEISADHTSDPDYFSNTRMLETTNSAGATTGFELLYPSGAMDVYAFIPWNAGDYYYFLSQQIDPHGRTTTYVYDTNSYLLQFVIDCDGRTNTFSYATNPTTGSSTLVSRITDPFGRYVTFSYYPGADGDSLSNVVDAAGNETVFTYSDSSEIELTNMTTAYGTTSFDYSFNDSDLQTTNMEDLSYQYCHVTEPDNGQEMFLFVAGEDFSGVPRTYTDTSNVPTVRPTGTLDNPDWGNPGTNDYLNWANSFYWNRAQFANLPGAFLNSPATTGTWDFDDLSANDYANARLRHWNTISGTTQGNSLSMERLPSPDGVTPGKMTWWDYPGKPTFRWQGTSAFPSLEIRVQPDGTEWYQMYQADQWGNRTNVVSTYSINGVVALRTNTYVYSTNTVDLLQVIGPDSVTTATYTYTNHELLSMTDATNATTTYTYNANMQVTSTTEPTGLVTTNTYDSNNRLYMTYSYGGGVYYGTNIYTYTNDLVDTHTDPRNLTTINTWDTLERLTNVAYPGASNITYVYSNLDLVTLVDRLGLTTSFTYDKIRRKTSETDANSHTTYYGYCDCGGLAHITNALGKVTQFTHDNQGNVTGIYYPDGYGITNTFNSIRQLTVRTAGANALTHTYNNQGLLTAVSDGAGLNLSRTYDINDRLTNSVDQNGVTIQMVYDELGRMVSRSYPDAGMEQFGYSEFGLVAYTNQLTNVTYYNYNPKGWKIAETNALNYGTQFGYDPDGDLNSLTDQNTNTTRWLYDQYGRVTNKVDATGASILQYNYDADNRLTTRWSIAKTNTAYGYDNVGNLTSVSYPSNHAVSFSYDAMNELITMSDGIGATAFTYTPAGQMASETGPWASDTVTYTYSNRLRARLNLYQPNGSSWMQNYGYDAENRLQTLASPAGTFGYTYDPGLDGTSTSSSLIDKLVFPNGSWISNFWDDNARMTTTCLYNSGGSNLDSSVYTYNKGSQRTQVIRNAENYANYTYDKTGQVTGDQAYENAGGARLNEQLAYVFDPAGNLNYRTKNALIENFQVNTLNELTANTNGGTLTVMGTTTSSNTSVTVNGTNASSYNDATFAATNMPLSATYTAIAHDGYGREATSTVNVSLATNITYQYDGNGNLTNDGLRNFVYDDENQLTQVSVSNQWMSQFQYDGKMRRRIRKEFAWQSAWVQTNIVYYVYDGNLVIQERDAHNLPTVIYTRGKDLSGSLEGAGGIGGLLARTAQAYADGLTGGNSFYHADGNGNVTMLINSSQTVVAKYFYNAFGNTLSKSGLLADANSYRFSGKEWHPNSGLIYYLYRYYDPNLQRSPNRDPLGEPGFESLHLVSQPLFIRNLRFAINESEMQYLLAMAMQSGSVNVSSYLRNSHVAFRGNAISALGFFNLLRNGRGSYAPNWPAELLEYPNLYKYLGSDPINGIDPGGLSWYNPWSWGIWDTPAEAIWSAIQYIVPGSEFPAAAGCGPDIYTIITNQPPKKHFDPYDPNSPVPIHPG